MAAIADHVRAQNALLAYLTVNANGQVYRGPGIKR